MTDEDVSGVCLKTNSLIAGATLEAHNRVIVSLPQMFADDPVKLKLILEIILLNQKEYEEAAVYLTQKKLHNLEEAKPAKNLGTNVILKLEVISKKM